MKSKFYFLIVFMILIPACAEKKMDIKVPTASSKKLSIRADQYDSIERKYAYGEDHKNQQNLPYSGKIAQNPINIQSPQFLSHQGENLSKNVQNYHKRALIIGNGSYVYGGSLSNPVNDARAMAEVLERLGFNVSKYENIRQIDMKKAVDDFGKKLKGYEVGLFFYAGHGIQVDGVNYLIPIDAKIDTRNDVEYNCVRAGRILSRMEEAESMINIIILDACRDNPFERSWTRSAMGKGLAFMDAPSGSIIAYATSPGTTASDGPGQNGVYTSALLQHMQTPNIAIEEMFKRVRIAVENQTGKRQIPWESTSLKGNFYFRIEK